MARNYSSVVEPKTLTGTVSSAATQITLNNVTGLPSPPYVLVLNPDTAKEEAVLVTVDQTGVTSPTLKVSRAIEASGGVGVAQDHTIGDTVKHMIVGTDLQIVHDHFSNDSTTAGTAHGATGGIVGRTNSQTLTNKTINLTDNTVTGTLAQFNTALSGADFATLTGTETLTNKTLTSPSIGGATMTGTTTFPTSGSGLVPVGAVNMWVTGTAPTGWVLCQGQELAVAGTYNALSVVLGTTYGALTNGSGGTGTTHFRVPDLRGRAPIGAGLGRNVADNANLTTSRTLGQRVSDAQTVTLTGPQSGIAQHNHSTDIFSTSDVHYNAGFGSQTQFARGGGSYIENKQLTTTNSGPTTAAESHENTQPSTVINFIIKF